MFFTFGFWGDIMLRDVNIYADGYLYQRNRDFVTKDLETVLATKYQAKKVFLTNSCMEAITSLFEYLLPVGGKVLVNCDTYYETRQWLQMARRYQVLEIDFKDIDAVEKALQQDFDVVYFDNPSFFYQFYDVEKICKLAHQYSAKVIVDNTILSFYYMNPLENGADYVVESFSKYVSGHGDVMAGGIICHEEPDESLALFLGRRGRVVSSFTVFLLERSLETLAVRMEKHTENGKYIFNKLKEMGVPAWYAGVGGCIILPGKGEDFCDNLEVFKKAPTFGITYSTASFVRSPNLYRVKSYARLSCGLEDKDVLWEDVCKALLIS